MQLLQLQQLLLLKHQLLKKLQQHLQNNYLKTEIRNKKDFQIWKPFFFIL